MKTVGDLIKEARLRRNYSREDLGEISHIKMSFIAAIEKADWENLPEFNIVIGFVKSIAHFLDIPENQAVSILRRDYPPKLIQKVNVKTKKENFGKRFMWGPRMTFLAGVLVIILIVLGYLGFQYRKFNQPPSLIVNEPSQSEIVKGFHLNVVGQTDPDATLMVNDQPVIVNGDGSFNTQIDIN